MDHITLWRRVRRGIEGKKKCYSSGQSQDVDAEKLDSLVRGSFIWGAELTPGGVFIYMQLPPGDVIALSLESTEDQADGRTALKIRRIDIG